MGLLSEKAPIDLFAMESLMRARLIRIGNSRGVRIPRPLIEEARLGDEVELLIRGESIVIQRAKPPREGWSDAAAALATRQEQPLLDPPTPTRFDEEEWEW
jgi:antitoxin MazE